jgi:hypothetical protein
MALACSGDTQSVAGLTGPEKPAAGARNGILHTQKDCTNYVGLAGDTCFISQSNLREISVGSIIRYMQATNADLTSSTDVILDAGGTSKAFGHCTVDARTGTGECVFKGGIGDFRSFSATLAVTPVGGVIGAWDGTYRFDE